MSQYVHVSNADLVGNINHFACLSYDKTEFAETVVTVKRNQYKAQGKLDLASNVVRFHWEDTDAIVKMCLAAGVCFKYC